MIEKKKTPWGALAGLLLLSLVAGYYLGGVFNFPDAGFENYEELFGQVLMHPFRNYFNEMTLTVEGLVLMGWIFLISWYLQHHRDTHSDIECGSAEWADVHAVNRQLADKNDPKNNRILSKNLRISLDGPDALSNNNGIYIGSPGTGKSMMMITPNLLNMASSYVFLDVKGELLGKYGNYLDHHGYDIKVLNLRDMEKSNTYNPFHYIASEDDIPRLIMNIFKSVEPPDAAKSDPFWDDGCALYLQSIFYFVWMVPWELKKQILALVDANEQFSTLSQPEFRHATMNQVTLLAQYETEFAKYKTNGTPVGSKGRPYTVLNKIIDVLAEVNERKERHPAVRDYRELKGGAQETVSSIILILNAKMKFFNSPSIKRIFDSDEMHLEYLGTGRNHDEKTKTALFLVVKENDTSYNFLCNMLYQQLFDVLIRVADEQYHGRLPIRVEAWLDEFANGVRPERFENLITTLRSRNIAAMIFLQSRAQIESLYKDGAWQILFDACSSFIFLGCGRGSKDTQEFISELLDNATIAKSSDSISGGQQGGGSVSYDRKERRLFTPGEVGRMNKNKCVVLLEGTQPIFDSKYRPFEDANFKEAMSYGPYVHPVRVRKNKNGVYETLGSSEVMGRILTDEHAVEYYRKEADKKGSGIRIYELTEEELLAVDIPDYDPEEAVRKQELKQIEMIRNLEQAREQHVEAVVKAAVDQKQEEYIRLMQQEAEPEAKWNLEGDDPLELIFQNMDLLDDDQIEQIKLGWSHGLTMEQIKSYFTLPAGRMVHIRELMEAKNQKAGKN